MDVTETEARYLKIIYRKKHEEGREVNTTGLADSLDVSPGTVTETLQKLDKKDYLNYEPYHGVKLTKIGKEKSKKLLRKHRILETFLVGLLDYKEVEACQEACTLDYHISENVINSICSLLGHPEKCPCGKYIFKNPKKS
ncbi:MAG: Mn-dependent transcriptional regulator DtxR family [Candidatus Methanohalarchaeum thermophilum]|uniref:Mn-dependent transcriptional regulator DtxR family n=1 Tax=Methanohalarchaeum thermophilum TaxID=1903181 RepID=A0A1Q6DSW2_METT1|nr:MAG: Mn-dependent transcriptional regulator DtxR family [Candidatus Methanohalarchaeum thermophilum]